MAEVNGDMAFFTHVLGASALDTCWELMCGTKHLIPLPHPPHKPTLLSNTLQQLCKLNHTLLRIVVLPEPVLPMIKSLNLSPLWTVLGKNWHLALVSSKTTYSLDRLRVNIFTALDLDRRLRGATTHARRVQNPQFCDWYARPQN